jgi:CubicO group peptidase (beta-lactamase class C family)
LILNGGTVRGKRLVSSTWIERSLANQVSISDSDPYADSYGFMWYTRAEPLGSGTIEVHFASGNGGNKIYIVPSLHMVVAITSSAYNTNYGQRHSGRCVGQMRGTNPQYEAVALSTRLHFTVFSERSLSSQRAFHSGLKCQTKLLGVVRSPGSPTRSSCRSAILEYGISSRTWCQVSHVSTPCRDRS